MLRKSTFDLSVRVIAITLAVAILPSMSFFQEASSTSSLTDFECWNWGGEFDQQEGICKFPDRNWCPLGTERNHNYTNVLVCNSIAPEGYAIPNEGYWDPEELEKFKQKTYNDDIRNDNIQDPESNLTASEG